MSKNGHLGSFFERGRLFSKRQEFAALCLNSIALWANRRARNSRKLIRVSEPACH